MYVMGRFQPVRNAAALYYRCLPVRKAIVRGLSPNVENVDIERVVSSLRKDGVANGLALRSEALEELTSFCNDAVCFGNGQRQYPFLLDNLAEAETAHGLKFTIGRYLGALTTCPRLQSLTCDPILLAIASRYFRTEPVLVGARIWWSFPASSNDDRQRRDGQQFHFDLDDYRALSFFFYLYDVDDRSGPHVVVKGSHRWKPLRYLVSLGKSKSREEIIAAYGRDQVVTIRGRAGSGFVEDLFCYHKGDHPRSRGRLLLQLRFGFTKYGKAQEE
jgi:hypothetical protein